MSQTIVTFIGPTGSGKDTQAELVSKHFGYKIVKLGRLVRDAAKLNTKIEQTVQSGDLASNEFVNNIIVEQITTSDSTDRILLDGYPRELSQAKWLDTFLDANSTTLRMAFYFELSDEAVRHRLSLRQREDDTKEAIEHRLEIFHHITMQVIEYYRQQDRLCTINADQSVDAVFTQLKEGFAW